MTDAREEGVITKLSCDLFRSPSHHNTLIISLSVIPREKEKRLEKHGKTILFVTPKYPLVKMEKLSGRRILTATKK